jgi:flagellar hook-associated protein 3 FlgL
MNEAEQDRFMKISTQLLFNRAADQMSIVQNKLADSQAHLAQGKQILKPSDAPDQAAVIQRLKSVMSRQESFLSSMVTLRSRLENEDTTLKSASDLLIRAKEVAVHAANDTLSPVNRKALAKEMQAVRDQLLSLANSKDNNGNFLFAGSRSKEPAFKIPAPGESPVYQGDQTKMTVMVGEQRSIPTNRSGTDAFISLNRPGSTEGSVTGVSFFKVMDDLVSGINNSDDAAMQRGIGEMTDLLNGMSLAHADIGTDMNVVDQQTSVIEDTILNIKTNLSTVEDLDYADAITKMNQQMLSLEAAQSSFSKIAQLTLFNYLK